MNLGFWFNLSIPSISISKADTLQSKGGEGSGGVFMFCLLYAIKHEITQKIPLHPKSHVKGPKFWRCVGGGDLIKHKLITIVWSNWYFKLNPPNPSNLWKFEDSVLWKFQLSAKFVSLALLINLLCVTWFN